MNTNKTENIKKETYPFRKLAYASFLKGGLLILLGLTFLFLVKSDFKQENYTLVILKTSSALIFLTTGIRLLIRGYKNEYDFSLKDIFDKTRNIEINKLLGQRNNMAHDYDSIFRTISFSSSKEEINKIESFEFLIFKLFSKKGMSEIFDYVPYPISNFIANQLKPISLIGYFIIILMLYGFLSYLEIIPFGMTWINLFILTGLLTLWYPSKIDSVLKKENKYKNGRRILYFIIFYIVTILLYKPYENNINYGLLITILVLVVIIIFTSILSFKLIHITFSNRKEVDVYKSSIEKLKNNKIGRQPDFLRTQFESIITEKIGCYFSGYTKKFGGNVSGDQKHKGTFEDNIIYETNPRIVSTTYNNFIEKKLSLIYTIGVILFLIGLITIFIGITTFPKIQAVEMINNTNFDLLAKSAPKIMLSLFLILFGSSLYFFGNKLVYEIFLFFNTEIFFESNLILFNTKGSYDQYELLTSQRKDTNTSTDYVLDIQVCKVTSSIFIHPYLDSNNIKKLPRFISKIQNDDLLLDSILNDFDEKLVKYKMDIGSLNNEVQIISKNKDNNLLNE